MRFFKNLFCALFLLSFNVGTSFANDTPSNQTALNKMLARVMPSVVNIKVEKEKPTYTHMVRPDQNPAPEQRLVNIGSGVIIDAKQGYIVTNAHVLKDEKLITITLKDSRKFTGKLIGSDSSTDIAVIQIDAEHLTNLAFANSNDVVVGDYVAAIGSPFGLDQTVTSGIVSALGRRDIRPGNIESYIQTDAPINMGNSGGALVNMTGKLVGINTAILATDRGNIGIGFAIPINTVKAIAAQLIKYGSVKRGLMGVLVQNLTPALADALGTQRHEGALVTIVNQNSPAARAGITTGDVIVAVNGETIRSSTQLISDVGVLRANTPITLTLIHNGTQRDVAIKLNSKEVLTAEKEKGNPFFYATSLRDYAEFNPNYGNIHGVQVLSIASESNASRDGLRPGDVILSANLTHVKNIDALHKVAVSQHKKPLLLNVLRQAGAFFITLSPATGKISA